MFRMERPFRQIDVFGEGPLDGNPVAVVLDATGVNDATMRQFSVWSNLSECTFVLPPTSDEADYLVRIFSLGNELPFAGHPTLGTARAWLDGGGVPQNSEAIIQQCGSGLVSVRADADLLMFAAPPRTRTGPLAPDLVRDIAAILGIGVDEIVDTEWLDNGPGWAGVLLDDYERVLQLRPDASRHPGHWDIGVIGPLRSASSTHGAAFELRAFFTDGAGSLREDPVTGSLNAAAAEWLISTGRAKAGYLARQGTALNRRGLVHVSADDDHIWVGGRTDVVQSGSIDL